MSNQPVERFKTRGDYLVALRAGSFELAFGWGREGGKRHESANGQRQLFK